MNHRRAILALFVVAATIMGTTGYSTVQSERTVDVQVTDTDANAYLGIEETGTAIENGTTGTVVELTNQFGESVDLSIRMTTSEDITNRGLTDRTIDPGETAALEVRCRDSQTSAGTIAVDVEASGDGVSFEKLDREVTVMCVDS